MVAHGAMPGLEALARRQRDKEHVQQLLDFCIVARDAVCTRHLPRHIVQSYLRVGREVRCKNPQYNTIMNQKDRAVMQKFVHASIASIRHTPDTAGNSDALARL